MKARRLGWAICLLLATAAIAPAQTTTYLSPAAFEAALDTRLSLRLESWPEAGRVEVPWSARDSRWLLVRAAGTQTNQDRPSLTAEGEATIDIAHSGVHLVGLDLGPRMERLSRAEADRFFTERVGRELPPATADQERLVLRRIESGKALIRVPGRGGPAERSATAQSKTGQTVEIRPLVDPTTIAVGADLPFKVYMPRGGSDGVAVHAIHGPSGARQTVRTNPSGVGHFRLTTAGSWRIEAHHALPVVDDVADWVVYSATLTFAVAADPPTAPVVAGGAR